MRQKPESYFLASYSDLMTSLFFIMLVLFVLAIAVLHRKMAEIESERKASQEQLEKIKEIEEAINRIDSVYFDYNETYKKHILKTKVQFGDYKSDIREFDYYTRMELLRAGKSIQKSLLKINQEYPQIQYLLVIEGQASQDKYEYNYELSYARALALRRFWRDNNIDFGDNCEVLISGSGTGGAIRAREEKLNQRFLIQILPKPGIIE